MVIDFCKYQGAGNDFVIIDNMSGLYDNLQTDAIARLCDRRFGIGADGLLLLSASPDHDFRMVYYNQDGSRASFCGNGARCLCDFAVSCGVVKPEVPFRFTADDGSHTAIAYPSRHWVDLQMTPVNSVERISDRAFRLNTGVPHYVEFVDDLDSIDIMNVAPKIRFAERFMPDGVNVNFAKLLPDGHVAIRTYERGVEGETLACGTGITASAISAAILTGLNGGFKVDARGGNLEVRFHRVADSVFDDVHLCGPAVMTFKGLADSLI